MRLLVVSLFLGVLTTSSSSGQIAGPADTTEAKPLSWSLLPIVFSSPDTDWAFGLLPQVVFRMPETERQSRVFVAAYYTQKGQYAISTVGSVWFNQDRDHVELVAETTYWPTTFYGFSSGDPGPDFESADYTERKFSAAVSASRQFGQTFRIGLKGGVRKTEVLDFSLGIESLLPIHTPGEEGGWVVGLGPSIGLDSRDQVFYPMSGWYVEFAALVHGDLLGGDYDYLTVQGDVRTYRRLSGNHVIAAQALFDLKSEDVPFWGMNGIGNVVRGFSSMQFLDRQLVAGQVEYRIHPLFWRIGLAAFVGAGVVARHVDDLPSGRIRWAAGLGLRIAFMQDAKINIRWDFGWGEGTSGDYLDMGEAF